MKNETRTAPLTQSHVSQPEEKLSPWTEELDGIRIRGAPELKEKNARRRNEHDYSEFQKIRSHREVNAEIGDIVRLGQYEEKKTRTILLKVPNVWQRRMILSSAIKLKEYSQSVFISQQLSKEETVLESEALMKRRDLINRGTTSKDLRFKDCSLYICKNNQGPKLKVISLGQRESLE